MQLVFWSVWLQNTISCLSKSYQSINRKPENKKEPASTTGELHKTLLEVSLSLRLIKRRRQCRCHRVV